MPHFITVPINENGIIFDADMNGVVAEAIAFDPFEFTDVYVYSHGWSNDAARALDEYNRFSVDLHRQMIILGKTLPPPFARPPGDSLGIGIHWPSQITEDPNSVLNDAQLLTFYTMEHRAEQVGQNAVYSMLRLMIEARDGTPNPLRFFLLGHIDCAEAAFAYLFQYLVVTNLRARTFGLNGIRGRSFGGRSENSFLHEGILRIMDRE